MYALIKNSAIMSLMMFSIFLFNHHIAQAAGSIEWQTTNVKLEYQKCTVEGYFKNNTNKGLYVTYIRFVVDVLTENKKNHLYSAVWDYAPNGCYIPAYSQKSWSFWYNDKSCPSYSGKRYWAVNYNVNWK